MTVELITGHQNTPHVTPAQQAALTAAIIGTGDYVLPADRWDLTKPTFNSAYVTVPAGYGVNHGYQWQIVADETLTLQPGAQGMNRNDLVVVERSTDAESGADAAALKVVSGAPTAGGAADPVTTDMQHVLFRVSLSGINVDVEPVYELLDMQVSKVRPELDSATNDLKTEITGAQTTLQASIDSLNSRISTVQSQMSQGDQGVSKQMTQQIINQIEMLRSSINVAIGSININLNAVAKGNLLTLVPSV
jgi:hypothetical protein